jgi:hypothetical protein
MILTTIKIVGYNYRHRNPVQLYVSVGIIFADHKNYIGFTLTVS